MKYTTEEGRKILKGADVIIVDGDSIVPKEIHQIILHVVAALPGDEVNLNIILFSQDPTTNYKITNPNFLELSDQLEKCVKLSCSCHQNNQIYEFRIPNILFTCLINSRARHSAIYKLKSRNLF